MYLQQRKDRPMKRTLAILALALFLGGMGSSAVMAAVQTPVAVSVSEDDKKSDTTTENKAEATKETKECTTKETKDCSKECEKKCDGEKKESKNTKE
jgi:hypothetical protein